ncbi:lyase family protein [uncultured Azohydromonas sp.]|jgi:Fumarase|uniref:class II fumarate hydratase n=1 Tax=uncultured Azohydromonas sp. TaxID=487342 RepID=UPI0026226692|nr:class II fumarate hydratase [uncultured Azohydromonas sp.]
MSTESSASGASTSLSAASVAPEGDWRLEKDSMGEVRVPAHALWGAQTQRAVENFNFGSGPMPAAFVEALLHLKAAAARANEQLGLLEPALAQAIADSADALLADPRHPAHFPVEVFQTGSGTSSNMNANEVLATLAAQRLGKPVSPNDHVNFGQSSNDTVPSAIHVAAALQLERALLPALAHLALALENKAPTLRQYVKTGRTHLMDAMPVRFDQVLGGWRAQVQQAINGLCALQPAVATLAQGGTAVGTGVNTHPEFAATLCALLQKRTGIHFQPAAERFSLMGAQDTAVQLSGQLKATAVCLIKIANDLRWMNSGPLAGLAEIELPALQPGSSIMPGKVNPVIPEAVAMAGAQVIGNDAAITLAGQSGNFELNVMLPLVARNLLESQQLLAAAARALADRAIAGFTVNEASLRAALSRNPVLVTALNPLVGYLKAAEIAKAAYKQGRPIIDVAEEMTDLGREKLQELLDPARLTEGGL